MFARNVTGQKNSEEQKQKTYNVEIRRCLMPRNVDRINERKVALITKIGFHINKVSVILLLGR